MNNLTMTRRKLFSEPQATMVRVMGENSVEVTNAKNSKLVKLLVNFMETVESEERKIVFRGKNLLNPMREFQNDETCLSTIENLKAGSEDISPLVNLYSSISA